ncbi:MAG: putative peptidase [uncultured bacterium]|uniref:Peptidase S9 prolyl oligopeptidase catalytic domain-containing protein n=1 Tax=Candidatus Curtissbacteria bacterium RIFOXYA1_FULL_41_14 TaxID=1797737 RepID=A0A1F5HCP1_9BACT|nr:MAG: putative peptidase [uncultured bacterium]KKR57270.1 MAG: putative peptidase [Candidatus Curtissbacteria bacterium GW2011_GWB1_40_28]KKR61012.1 MAG: hypothetical protein UU00_C0022G0009 [Microgenomates group bacterium GW2011_GWC1_40_35]KKS00848.1 MAG: putative peptidase [Candidatus Curtissbacteria bacterium GW2011_GWC2_41_21]OGD79433.1 MAG: hypothetical protein A2683_02830 [Candidatus Curtissbacteria bacterium RIFCSPHIGHO2_01_FULL_34_40]OGD91780.1 MAG: hypothetical protein A3E14_03660 [
MRKSLIVLVILVVVSSAFYFLRHRSNSTFTSPNSETLQQKSTPLIKYAIEALSKTNFNPSQISLGELVNSTPDFTSRIFYFYVDPSINSGQGRKVSGLINIPNNGTDLPVIVMFRGYVDREKYQTGVGTNHAGEVFAKNGFITLAPDFLGYGESDMPSENPMEERFQTHTTALTLLASVKNLNAALSEAGVAARADPDRIAIWGHSNGGQIALTILEITGKSYPTVLWAPVSKPFPYSILYYTDDFDDHGRMLRKVVADFEKDYDSEGYSLASYFEKIKAPVQLHQGGADEAVPLKWSDQLYEQLKELDRDIQYFTYTGEDHNFAQGAWGQVVNRNIVFYQRQFGSNKE